MKAIFIVGPTATGKTDLALTTAKQLLEVTGVKGVDILSADSKQVYRGEDIVTGKDKEKLKDLPASITVHGLDLVSPDEEWSVAHFLKYAAPVISRSQALGHALIVVGGTGQYATSLIKPPQTAWVTRNETLRQELDGLSVSELQERLSQLDSQKLEAMNSSDRQNPRRLVRAIEVAGSDSVQKSLSPLIESPLIVGLALEPRALASRIRQRVEARLEAGAIPETEALLNHYPNWRSEAKAAIGYLEIESFLKGEINREMLTELWTLHEVQYAKRQRQWFVRQLPVEWFEADKSGLGEKVAARVRGWYTV